MIADPREPGPLEALHDPVILGAAVAVAVVLLAATVVVLVLGRLGRIDDRLRRELLLRCGTWAVLVPLILVPVLLGGVFVFVAVGLLSLGCYGEYARATGLFRHRLVHGLVALGIVVATAAAATKGHDLFVALLPLTVCLISAGSILPDRPRGYLQRTSLAVFGFVLFGACLTHVGLLAHEPDCRSILVWLLLAVELNDVFAFLTGKLIGGPKLRPNTSPNKTLAAAIGATVLTTILVAGTGHLVFAGQPIDRLVHLCGLGLIISIAGQFGDLVLSSIKRDLGLKDMAASLPGHGGLLDRFDSLLLVAPVVYYYLAFFQGVAAGPSGPPLTG